MVSTGLLNTDLDYLVINNFIFEKAKQENALEADQWQMHFNKD